jgi:hypothetical protein
MCDLAERVKELSYAFLVSLGLGVLLSRRNRRGLELVVGAKRYVRCILNYSVFRAQNAQTKGGKPRMLKITVRKWQLFFWLYTVGKAIVLYVAMNQEIVIVRLLHIWCLELSDQLCYYFLTAYAFICLS